MISKVRLGLALSFVFAIILGQCNAATSTEPGGMNFVNAQQTGASIGSGQSQPLTGEVKKVQISLESLRDVGLDLKEIMTASRHLYDEVSIQPVTLITQPSMVGPGTIINIPVGTMPVGPPQPPRKERVDLAMQNMTPIINLFKQNADEFVSEEKQLDVSPEVQAKLDPLVKEWINNVGEIYQQLKTLEPLTHGPSYDNAAIASVCRQMQNTAQALDKVRSKAFKIIKRQSKS